MLLVVPRSAKLLPVVMQLCPAPPLLIILYRNIISHEFAPLNTNACTVELLTSSPYRSVPAPVVGASPGCTARLDITRAALSGSCSSSLLRLWRCHMMPRMP